MIQKLLLGSKSQSLNRPLLKGLKLHSILKWFKLVLNGFQIGANSIAPSETDAQYKNVSFVIWTHLNVRLFFEICHQVLASYPYTSDHVKFPKIFSKHFLKKAKNFKDFEFSRWKHLKGFEGLDRNWCRTLRLKKWAESGKSTRPNSPRPPRTKWHNNPKNDITNLSVFVPYIFLPVIKIFEFQITMFYIDS